MVALFDTWIQAVGSFGYLMLGLAAMLEYVVPPFPGDSILVLGGIYAVRGDKPWGLVLAAIMLGSVVGSAIDYGIGRLIAGRVERKPEGKLFFGISPERLHQLQAQVRARGTAMILLNRFLPGVRSLLFVAAGAARMSFGKVLLLGSISSLAWNVLLLGLGIAMGGNAERLERWVMTYQRGVLSALVVVAVAVLLVRLFKRRAVR